ncbi:MAG: HD domain-containing protein [Planctomycetota bacterium]
MPTSPAPSDLARLLQAATFAAHHHRAQKRKGNGDPYIGHPLQVAAQLATVGGVTDVALLCAAILHDTVEDTEATPADLAREFGDDVAALVAEVTDDKSLPKAERKQLQIDHMPERSKRAQQLKIADKTCNVRDLSQSPPAGWPLSRCEEYVTWAERVVAGARGVNPALEAAFDEACAATRAALRDGHE